MGIYQEICENLRVDYTKRKQTSVKYSNQQTLYFKSIIAESYTCSEQRREEIQDILTKSKKQFSCSIHIEHILAAGKNSEGDCKVEKMLLENRRCTLRKSCPICAAIDGMKQVEKMLSYFRDNPDLIVYPFSVSPKNYTAKTLRLAVRKAHKETEAIYDYFKDKTRKRAKSRGKGKAKKAIEQLTENMTACFFSKEFEPGRTATEVNAHYHGLIFMKVHESGSHQKTLSYESIRAFFEDANGGRPCQVEIGDTQNNNGPITSADSAMKAFLETAKYIIKMPTKCSQERFNERQALIWEVTAATHRDNFIKQGGELVQYKVSQNTQMWTPEELKHHELCYNRKDYDEHISPIDQEFVNQFWRENITIEHTRFKLTLAQQKLDRVRDPEKAKNLAGFIKRLNTIIEKAQAHIQCKEHVKKRGRKFCVETPL